MWISRRGEALTRPGRPTSDPYVEPMAFMHVCDLGIIEVFSEAGLEQWLQDYDVFIFQVQIDLPNQGG